jgi:hypothetical protein
MGRWEDHHGTYGDPLQRTHYTLHVSGERPRHATDEQSRSAELLSQSHCQAEQAREYEREREKGIAVQGHSNGSPVTVPRALIPEGRPTYEKPRQPGTERG